MNVQTSPPTGQLTVTGNPVTIEMRTAGVTLSAKSISAIKNDLDEKTAYLASFDMSDGAKFVSDSDAKYSALLDRAKLFKGALPDKPIGKQTITLVTDSIRYAGDATKGVANVEHPAEITFARSGKAKIAGPASNRIDGTFQDTVEISAQSSLFQVRRDAASSFEISFGEFFGPIRCQLNRAELVAGDAKSRTSSLLTTDHLKYTVTDGGAEIFAEGHVHLEGTREGLFAVADCQNILIKFDANMNVISAEMNHRTP